MTAHIKRIALFGEGIYSRSALITRQRRLNCYLEVRKDGDKSSVVCLGTPGLKPAFTLATPGGQSVRGMLGTASSFYAVAGNLLTSVSRTGATLASQPLPTAVGGVSLALNPTQLMIVDGVGGYVYTPATNSLSIVAGAFPNGAQSLAQCNGFFACERPGSNQFFVSALNDGTTWNGLSFAAAVQAPDGIVAVDTLGGLLVPFSTGHVEFWQNSGLTQEPFAYITNSASMYGLAAINGRVHVGDSMFFLARTNGGGFQNASGGYKVCRITGYSVVPVSTTDVDNILAKMAASGTVSDCTAYSYQVDEHQFVQFNFPSANRSLLLDATTGFWGEAQSGFTPAYSQRHLGNASADAYGSTYVADYSNGNIYTPDPNTYTDNGNTIVREVITKTALEDYNTMSISEIFLDMRTGVGLPGGTDPHVELSLAKDNGPFGLPRRESLGRQGQYTTRVDTRRWGRADQAALRIRVTDPTPFEIAGGAMRVAVRDVRMRGGRA